MLLYVAALIRKDGVSIMSGRIFSEVSWRLRQMADFLGLRKHYNTRLYEFILSRAERLQVDLDFWKFMNYGYEPSDPARRPNLDETDEADRVCIQLYQHLVETESMAGKSNTYLNCIFAKAPDAT